MLRFTASPATLVIVLLGVRVEAATGFTGLGHLTADNAEQDS